MTFRPFPLLTAMLFACASGLLRGEDAAPSPPDDTERAFALEKAADFVVKLTDDGKFDIGVGRITSTEGSEWNGLKHVYFEQDELVSFFDRQRHKDLIVVIFHKSSRKSEAVRKEVAKMNAYFKDRGFKRIVIQQLLAFSRPIYSDITVAP
jgi:hypothetical protein